MTDDTNSALSPLVTQNAPPQPPRQAVKPPRVKHHHRAKPARPSDYFDPPHVARHTLQGVETPPPKVDAHKP